jgi:hypothetical protein
MEKERKSISDDIEISKRKLDYRVNKIRNK